MSAETQWVEEVITRHQANPEALAEILREINEQYGYLTRAQLLEVSRQLQLPSGRVFGVATFYSMLSVKPRGGKHVIQLCEDAPCHVAGGQQVLDTLQNELGIKLGETTADGQWTLEATSCLGLCAVGPVIVIDGEVLGHITAERIPEILARYRDNA